MHLSCRSGYLCRISILAALLSHLIALASPAILETSWKPFPGAIDVGGCDQDIQNLRDSYSQAIELCQAAIAALGNIEEPKPEDPAEGQEWDRQARLAKAIFNIDANPAAPITDRAMRSRLGTILSEYTGEARREEDAEKMIGHYKRIIRQASTPSATKRIYCTPRFMVYVPKGYKTPWGGPISGSKVNTIHTEIHNADCSPKLRLPMELLYGKSSIDGKQANLLSQNRWKIQTLKNTYVSRTDRRCRHLCIDLPRW